MGQWASMCPVQHQTPDNNAACLALLYLHGGVSGWLRPGGRADRAKTDFTPWLPSRSVPIVISEDAGLHCQRGRDRLTSLDGVG